MQHQFPLLGLVVQTPEAVGAELERVQVGLDIAAEQAAQAS
jgi:hypothetical protein